MNVYTYLLMVNELRLVSGQPPSQPILFQNSYPWISPERYGLYQSRLYWIACVPVGEQWSQVQWRRHLLGPFPRILSQTGRCHYFLWSLQLTSHQVARHIFTGPSTAHGGDLHGVRLCNAALCHIHRFLQVQLWAFGLGLYIYFSLSPSVPVNLK